MAQARIKSHGAFMWPSARIVGPDAHDDWNHRHHLAPIERCAGADPAPACTASSCTVTFATAGLGQTWTVPNGAAAETITLYGAAGGLGFDAIAGGIGSAGGDGATVGGTLSLSAGTTVIVDVGGRGGSAAYGSKIGGINGGGSSTSSGGGGGATDIKVGGDGLSDRVLVAAGGGGAGADTGHCTDQPD